MPRLWRSAARRRSASIRCWRRRVFRRTEAATAAGLYVNLAQTNSNLHHLDGGHALCSKSRWRFRASYDRDERHLGRALGVLANTARFAGDLNGALQAIRGSRAIAEKLARADNVESMLQLGAAFWREGLILGELNSDQLRPAAGGRTPAATSPGDRRDARAQRSRRLYQPLLCIDGGARARRHSARRYDPARALACTITRAAGWAKSKAMLQSRRDEVWLLTGSSYALRRLGRAAEARQRIDAALAILRDLKEYPAASVDTRRRV